MVSCLALNQSSSYGGRRALRSVAFISRKKRKSANKAANKHQLDIAASQRTSCMYQALASWTSQSGQIISGINGQKAAYGEEWHRHGAVRKHHLALAAAAISKISRSGIRVAHQQKASAASAIAGHQSSGQRNKDLWRRDKSSSGYHGSISGRRWHGMAYIRRRRSIIWRKYHQTSKAAAFCVSAGIEKAASKAMARQWRGHMNQHQAGIWKRFGISSGVSRAIAKSHIMLKSSRQTGEPPSAHGGFHGARHVLAKAGGASPAWRRALRASTATTAGIA